MKAKILLVRNKINLFLKSRSLLYFLFAVALGAMLIAGSFLLVEKPKLENMLLSVNKSLKVAKQELALLKNEDQYKVNQELKDKIKKSEDTYIKAISSYEKLVDLRVQKQDTKDLDTLLAEALGNLSKLNYASAQAQLADLTAKIEKIEATVAQKATPSQPAATVSNTAPGSGFSYQAVKTDAGTFNVALVAADLNSTRVIVDTASDSDCGNNCPTLPLATYISRSGAFAGINGPFFCPAEYPTCAGKTNSFDTLLMNKNKYYFNSSNNVYSTVPLVYFSGNSMGVRGQSLDWGRDTGVDSVIANYPLYISGGNNNFGGSSDPKINSVGARTFIANKGSTAYIGIVYSASSANAALVLKTLGMDNALGLDQGGSTALWHGGYKAGPGRSLPSAILFVRR